LPVATIALAGISIFTGISILTRIQTRIQRTRFANAKFEPGFECKGLSTAPQRTSSASRWRKRPETDAFPTEFSDSYPLPYLSRHRNLLRSALYLSGWRRQRRGPPPQHASKEPARQMTLRQQQPVVARVLDQTSAGFHQALLQAGQRPGGDPRRQHQPPPQISEVVGDQAQPQPHLVGAEAVAGKPRHRDRLLAFFDPLLSRAALIVEPHHRAVVSRQGGHDEADAGEQLPKVELHLRHHPSRRLPTHR